MRTIKEPLAVLAKVLFFGVVLLWSLGNATTGNSWDSVLVRMTGMISGLGLVMVVVASVLRRTAGKSFRRPVVPMKVPKNPGKCT